LGFQKVQFLPILSIATNLKSFLLMKNATCQKYIAARATGYSTHRLFGAKFSTTMAQVCRRLVIAFLGPGFQLPRLGFIVESPFWSQAFSHQDSALSSACNRIFGAVFSAATVQLCRLLVSTEA
jgi:hypothetical protein